VDPFRGDAHVVSERSHLVGCHVRAPGEGLDPFRSLAHVVLERSHLLGCHLRAPGEVTDPFCGIAHQAVDFFEPLNGGCLDLAHMANVLADKLPPMS
jgi:hypothetical protein